jgi:hypothetical protein
MIFLSDERGRLITPTVPPLTSGFRDATALTEHFAKHGGLLGVGSEADYLQRADTFLGTTPCPVAVLEGKRANGDTVRLNLTTQEFGALRADGTIRTYHIRSGAPRDRRWFAKQCGI